jgi:hypothetical protein
VLDSYVTFLAGIFRSVRFGASDAHGRANIARFNFFKERGAFTRDAATGTYRVDRQKMEQAMNAALRADPALPGRRRLRGGEGVHGPLRRHRRPAAGRPQPPDRRRHPVDVVFEQGTEVLGLGR